MNQSPKNKAWSWVPTLYFAEGLPYVAVVTISVILYKRMGISNTDIALYTSLLYLPWVIKPFWSPFVDLLKTKRWWITIMQLLIGFGFLGIAFTIPLPFFFQATLGFFWLLAFSSATHDIAADGFYMLALETTDQAKFVGIRSTFYRFATIMGQGVLIILAGLIESHTGHEPLLLQLDVAPQYEATTLSLPEISASSVGEGEIRFMTNTDKLKISSQSIPADSFATFMATVKERNTENGFVPQTDNKKENTHPSWWTSRVSTPLGYWIKAHFGEEREAVVSDQIGNVGVVAVRISRSPGEEPAVLNTVMDKGDKSLSLIHGERLTFTQDNYDKTAYLVFQADPKLKTATVAMYKGLSGNIPLAWSVTFFVMAGLFFIFYVYHRVFLPRPIIDRPSTNVTTSSVLKEFGATWTSFFRKPQVATAIFFMLTYRFSEAQALKLINPFLLDSREVGGLGLTTGEVGFVYGTIGIIGLVLGGIIGGFAAAKGGLKKWLWPMALAMLLTIAVFVYLSFSQTENLWVINICIFVEQFGYGFGFTAYMLYLMYFSEGEHKTSHYAFCTGFMALGMMLPGLFAGWLQELLGYAHFFIWVMISCLLPIIAVSLLKIKE